MNKKIIWIGFCIILFNSFVASANVNLSISSENEFKIKIIPLSNFSNSYNNNTYDNINLPYDNYIINLYPDSTKLTSNNGTFILNNLVSFNNDKYKLIWISIIFAIIILAYIIIRRVF